MLPKDAWHAGICKACNAMCLLTYTIRHSSTDYIRIPADQFLLLTKTNIFVNENEDKKFKMILYSFMALFGFNSCQYKMLMSVCFTLSVQLSAPQIALCWQF